MGSLHVDLSNLTGPLLRRIAKCWQFLYELQDKSVIFLLKNHFIHFMNLKKDPIQTLYIE